MGFDGWKEGCIVEKQTHERTIHDVEKVKALRPGGNNQTCMLLFYQAITLAIATQTITQHYYYQQHAHTHSTAVLYTYLFNVLLDISGIPSSVVVVVKVEATCTEIHCRIGADL